MAYQFLSLAEVQGLYSLLMRDQGIVGALLDEGKLESATMRPQTRAYYEGGDLASLTASLIAGIALAHAYSDGNKRLSLLCGDTFQRLNGYCIAAPADELADQILAVVNRGDDLGARGRAPGRLVAGALLAPRVMRQSASYPLPCPIWWNHFSPLVVVTRRCWRRG